MINIKEAREITEKAKENKKLDALDLVETRITNAANQGRHEVSIDEYDLGYGDIEIVKYVTKVLLQEQYYVDPVSYTCIDAYGSTIKRHKIVVGW